MDIRPSGPAASAPVMPSDRPTKSAAALHARTTPSSSQVLDLRRASPSAKPAPVTSSAKITPAQPAQINHQTATPAPPPRTTTKERHLARFEDKFQRAQTIERSEFVSRFDRSNRFGGSRLSVVVPKANQPSSNYGHGYKPPAASHGPELPAATATQHAAMAQMANVAQAAHHAHDASWRPHLSLAPRVGQYAAVAVAVVIMGGYVWLQNYPKLAVQNASSRAGISASLPSYVPSSYILANTRTAPGIVTLDFTSPSQPGKLTISQHRTTWDSTSLLDQYIANKTPDYTAVQGQGLTVYLYGKNQAAWVNHGVWYSIEGATRLSRDQILKIAYSL